MWKFSTLVTLKLSCLATNRFLSTAQLIPRSLIRIQGDTAGSFLQGLITNDVTFISRPGSFMYSFMLNVKGRILTDTFIYHVHCEKSQTSRYLLEMDTIQTEELMKYFTRYNLRKKVQIEHETDVTVWIAMPSNEAAPLTNSQSWLPIKPAPNIPLFERDLLFYAADPRAIGGWSGRVLLKKGIPADAVFTGASSDHLTIEAYRRARWKLGLPEGSNELIHGETLPLEANGDLSGAVSFSKGCYVGQELTARTRFTGVVRRRFVPVRLRLPDPDTNTNLPLGCHYLNAPVYRLSSVEQDLQNRKSRPVGWLRALCIRGNQRSDMDGIALIRLTEISTNTPLVAVSRDSSGMELFRLFLTPYAPSWWTEEIAPDLERC